MTSLIAEQAKIDYTLARHREEALMVLVAVPGHRWEIEFFTDGSVEIEKFSSDSEIYGEEGLAELFALYADPEAETQMAARPNPELTAVFEEKTEYKSYLTILRIWPRITGIWKVLRTELKARSFTCWCWSA